MDKYKATIGLEIHAELSTVTKMFCNSKNDPDEKRPNVNICPVCMAHPGTLPVINKKAVENVIRVGLALGGEIADFTEFDRKNYFYPDIPKGYQISQYKFPIVSGGKLNGIGITKIHLEEDTARSQHDPKTGESLVDFNRAGVPLMELVTEPEIKNAKEAGDFARELQLLLQYLGVSEANMEKGEMRVEANISVSDTEKFGTKVEVKNLNSFRSAERAIEYEIERQIKLIESGDMVVQETRGFDENKGVTFSQRKKETSEDYRYFPDPDLPKLYLSKVFDLEELKKSLPELPQAKNNRLMIDYGLKDSDVMVYVQNQDLGAFFEEVVLNYPYKNDNQGERKNIAQLISNYITSDLVSLVKDEDDLPDPSSFSKLIELIFNRKISSRGAKDILAIVVKEEGDPEKIAEEKGLFQKSDEGELKSIVEKIISDNPKVVEEYKSGKESVLQFLVGQGMKETKGSANPEVLRKVILDSIK